MFTLIFFVTLESSRLAKNTDIDTIHAIVTLISKGNILRFFLLSLNLILHIENLFKL
jgi:hypothetical protein